MAQPKPARLALALSVCAALVFGFVSAGSSVVDSTPSANAALFHEVGTDSASGETLRLGATRDCDSFDPAISYDSWCQVVLRLYARNLVSYAGAAGPDSSQIVADLASQLPIVSADQKTWQVNLTPGLLWDDGTPITSADVRYTVERLFAQDLGASVPTSTLCLLSDCPDGKPAYSGPFVKGATDLAALLTPDDYTVVFVLNRPYAEFASILASTNFAIVQKTRDLELRASGSTYAQSPSSSGPFVLSEFIPGNQATFIRNANWAQETDGIRRPKVDEIALNIYSNIETVNAALTAGEIELKVDGGIDEAFLESVRTQADGDLLIDQFAPEFTNFITLNDQIAPLDNLNCREAINLALNRELLAQARGPQEFTKPALSLLPGVLQNSTSGSSVYGESVTGDVAAARKALGRCGKPGGFELSVAYLAVGSGPALFDRVRVSLARIGIVVNPVTFETAADYFVTGVGAPSSLQDEKIGAALVGWGATYDTVFSFWSRLLDSRKITKTSNVNYALFDDDELNRKLDQLESEQLPKAERIKIGREIERLVASERRYLPYATDQIVLYRPKSLTNVYVHWALGGQYDLVNVGIVRLSE